MKEQLQSLSVEDHITALKYFHLCLFCVQLQFDFNLFYVGIFYVWNSELFSLHEVSVHVL